MKLTTETYWDEGYIGIDFTDMHDHTVGIFLQEHLPDGDGKTAFEIGSYPGSFIPTIGRKGFQVSGVDFNTRNSTVLPQWLKSLGIKTGEFSSADFFDFIKTPHEQYNLVCSFGFIEHFTNYEEVILMHAKLVKPGGQLIITTPNFKGWMQYFPHLLIDRNNLKKHYIPSMSPQKWKNLLEKEGFKIQFAGFFGGYQFWVDRSEKRNGFKYLLIRFTERTISQLRKLFCKLDIQSSAFSGFAGIVAEKKI
jgi:2-polyprenyl-3-methyl-5-hydroxy-6-metoxy-1,4-benzoquinol methylase